MSRVSRAVLVLLLLMLVSTVVAGCGGTAAEPAAEPAATAPGTTEEPMGEAPATEDPGAALVEQKCTMCHTLDRVNDASYDEAGWTATVERMEKNGLVISADEKASIIGYLAGQ